MSFRLTCARGKHNGLNAGIACTHTAGGPPSQVGTTGVLTVIESCIANGTGCDSLVRRVKMRVLGVLRHGQRDALEAVDRGFNGSSAFELDVWCRGPWNMPRPERSSQMTEPDASWRWRRMVTAVVVIIAVVVLLYFGGGILAWWARQMAARRMNVGAVSAAEHWLAWSAWFDPGNANTDLMQAACSRRLRQQHRFSEALESAERKGAPATRIQQEVELGLIQSGALYERVEDRLGALIEAGVSPHDAATAVVYGSLARGERERAKEVLDAWAADFPEEPRVAYMRGVYWWSLGDQGARAQAEFEDALARQPRHEMARTALANLLEEENRPDLALQHYAELATRCPASETAKVGLARVLRKLGRLDEARAVLESLASEPEASSGVPVEVGQIEFESGNYEEAQRWFEQADLDQAHYSETLLDAATTFALAGNTIRAERLFARVDGASDRSLRLDELRVRLAMDANDRKAAGELQRLSAPSATPSPYAGVSGTEQAGEDRRESPATSAPGLYALYCGACHGASGDGNGRAARHLFPRPRDLRAGRFRLVSTLNGVPTLQDLDVVINQGMPGTSMRSFENLSEDERKLLAEEVLRLYREGFRDEFINALKNEGEQIDEGEVGQVVEECTTPGEAVRAPPIGPADSQAIARGKQMYLVLGCHKCHGEEGVGCPDVALFDDKGRPTQPRDLVHEPFKGDQEPESIYLRIFVGMPGTPHPGCWTLSEGQIIDLVHHCRSLSREPKRVLSNHERALQATRRAYLPAPDGSPAR